MSYERHPLNHPSPKPPAHASLDRAGIGRRYWAPSLAKIDDKAKHKKTITAYHNDIDSMCAKGTGLLLCGGHGTGKTSLACIVLKRAMSLAPVRVFFTMMPEIDWYARHRFDSSDGPSWKLITKSIFLVIDDVGSERQAEWNDCWLEEVIRLRYNDMLPTIVTTNQTPTVIFEKYPWFESIAADSMISVELDETQRWR